MTCRLLAWMVAGLVLLPGCAATDLSKNDARRTPAASAEGPRERVLFNEDWRFIAGPRNDAHRPDHDDRQWATVHLPHDFMIAGLGHAEGERDLGEADPGPFDRQSSAGKGGGYLNGGVAWYRKHFPTPPSLGDDLLFVTFEGVYMDSAIWLNGHRLGGRPLGYSTFRLELTEHLRRDGRENVLVVRADVPQPSSRWYSGGGLYRHVWLERTDPVHVDHWGTQVTTPEVRDERALVRVRTTVVNETSRAREVTLRTRIAGTPVEHEVAATIEPGAGHTFDQSLTLPRPRRWDLHDPHRYTLESRVGTAGRVTDVYQTDFGVRTIEFTRDEGFHLNGRRVEIRGVCLHHDQGPLGAAAFDRAIERQLQIMKSLGVNAIRTAHNPPAPRLLELCDRMGLMVMDEAFDEWARPKVRHGYARWFEQWAQRDLRDLLRRDRNHPSIIMWSIGNEIPEMGTREGAQRARRLGAIVREMDPTRPFTAGIHVGQGSIDSGFAEALDLIGLNYRLGYYDAMHELGITYASETASTFSSRGVYNLQRDERGEVVFVPRRDNHSTSYDVDYPDWGTRAEDQFRVMRDKPWVFAEFVWTGFDYLGEPTPYAWPSRSSSFGIVDLCGFKKDRFYLYQSQWTREPMVHLLPHWNWPRFAGEEVPVWAYSNADEVELFLNGESRGVRRWDDTQDFHLAWDVPYEPGTLRAVARRDGRAVATDEVSTAGEPARIELSVDRDRIAADRQDLAYVTARVVDDRGRLCPTAGPLIRFGVSGPGSIQGVGSGDPTRLEPFVAHRHHAFNGLALAIIRSDNQPGTLRITAHADGLEPGSVTVRSR